jgi:hypothetical protein
MHVSRKHPVSISYFQAVLFCLVLGYTIPGYSQHLAAYHDYRDHFFIFDRGEHLKVEDFRAQSFKIGGEQILYINSQGHLKMYSEGKVSELERGGASQYYATDHLAAYSIFEKLIVIKNGEPLVLTTRCPVYRVEDSLIVYYDKNREALRIYYNGMAEDIESGLVGMPAHFVHSGDNIVAYVSSRTKDFKIYYQGQNHTIVRAIDRISYKAGRDIVAYISPIDNSFNVFFKGELIRLEDFPPESYRMGDGFVAYVDESGAFKVFSEKGVSEVSSFTPQSYIADDQLLVFSEYEYFKLFSEGQVHELEPFIPRLFKMDLSTVVYVDNTNRIWLYSNGEKKYLANEILNDFNVYRNLVVLDLKMDRTLIYYQGEFYEGLSY